MAMRESSPPRDLTQGSIHNHMMRLSTPMFFGLLAVLCVPVIDAYYLGKLGVDPLAAMGFVFPILGFFMSISRGMSEGALSMVSRRLGAHKKGRAQAEASSIMVLAIILVLVSIIIGFLSVKHILVFLQAKGEVLELAHTYMVIWFGGMFFLVIPMVGNGFIRAAGDTTWPSLIMVFVALMNMLLDPILIFGWGPVPAMGMKGAAWASISARALTLVPAMYLIVYKYQLLTWKMGSISQIMTVWKQFSVVALPATFNFIMIPVTMAYLTKLMSGYSKHHVAAFGLAHQIEMLSLIVFLSIAVGLSSFVGQNYGAGSKKRLEHALFWMLKANMAIGLALFVLFFLGSEWIATRFNSNIQVVDITVQYLTIVSFSFAMEGVYISAIRILNATGKSFRATGLVFFRMCVVYLPVALLMQAYLGHKAIFWAAFCANILAGGLGCFLVRRIFSDVKYSK